MATAQSTTQATTSPAELPMEQYAAAVESGKNPAQATTAAATEASTSAAATTDDPSAAAATAAAAEEGKSATSQSASEVDPESQIEETHPAKKGIQKRFSEMTAKQKELQALADKNAGEAETARRDAEAAKAEVERLKAEAAQAAVPVVPDADKDPAPDRAAFDDPDEYVAALSAHTARAELRKAAAAAKELQKEQQAKADKAAQETRAAQVQAQVAELHKGFQARVAEVKAEYPDYDEKVTNNEKISLRNDVFFTIEQSKDAPHILYHLAQNPELASELNAMAPYQAAMRLGELQAELRVARKPKLTQAAAPITPVGSRQSPQAKSPNDESMAEYAARRDREMKEESARKLPKRAGNR